MYTHDFVLDGGTGNVVYMEREGRWQPVAAVCLVGHVSGRYDHDWRTLEDPSGEMAGLNPFDTVLWNDRNGDGKVQRNECVIVSAAKPGDAKGRGEPALSIRNGWGARLGDDFSIYVSGVLRYRPTGFAPDGAPIYGLDGLDQTGFLDKGEVDPVPVPGENELVCLTWGWDRRPKLAGIDLETRTVQWTYPNPYPGVHGSHDATMPKPGLLIGPLKTCGTATVNDAVGTVFLMRGNQGQDFLMTSDGLYVGAIFQDCRLPAESLPDAEAPLRSMPLEGLSEGGEPFNGWFGKQADGVIRLTTGMAREACMILQIKGLETVRRHMGGAVAVDAVAIARADADSAARAKKPAQPKRYVVKRLAKAPAIDDGPADWGDVPGLAIAREGAPDSAGVKLAYDDSNLYVMFDVRDSSPWRNEGKDYRRLFKTGDAVDLQIGLDAKPHRDPVAGDQRLVFGQVNGKPVVVRMAPVDKTAPAALNAKYTSPVGTRAFDRVEVLADAQVAVRVEGGRYRVKAAVPLATLGIAPKPGLALRGDAGFISSDAQGLIDIARTYWANPTTNLVNDLPSEAWLYPETWGELVLE
jgi:hypothetical protein